MSLTLSIQGVRGGVGVTTLVAALGQALRAQGERVLLVECSPDHLLGLHLGVPVAETRGWARAQRDGEDWRDAAFQCAPGLALLPYGAVDAAGVDAIEHTLRQRPQFWAERLPLLQAQFDWIVFDLPQRLPAHAAAVNQHACALPLLLATVDPGCHVLLQRQANDARRLLANRYDPALPLQRDLMQLWGDAQGTRLVPQPVHEDASVPAALARKLPLGLDATGSLAAVDVASLAIWCLAERGRLRGAQTA